MSRASPAGTTPAAMPALFQLFALGHDGPTWILSRQSAFRFQEAEVHHHQQTLRLLGRQTERLLRHCPSQTREAELHQKAHRRLWRRLLSCLSLSGPTRPRFTRGHGDLRFCRRTVLCDPKRPSFTDRLFDGCSGSVGAHCLRQVFALCNLRRPGFNNKLRDCCCGRAGTVPT